WPRVGNPVWDEVPVPKNPGKIGVAKPGSQPKAPSYPTSGSAASKKKKYAAARKAYNSALKTWKSKKAAYDKAKRAHEDRVRQNKQDKETRKRMIEDAKSKMNYWKTHDLLSNYKQPPQDTGISDRAHQTP